MKAKNAVDGTAVRVKRGPHIVGFTGHLVGFTGVIEGGVNYYSGHPVVFVRFGVLTYFFATRDLKRIKETL